MKTKNILFMLSAMSLCMFAAPTKAEALLAGVKTTGMAATSTAYPIDAFAGAYNPAAITLLCDRFDVGISWVHEYARLKIHDNQNALGLPVNGTRNAAKTSNVYVPEFGINKNFCFNVCNTPLQFSTGLVVYNRNYLKTTYGRPIELIGTTKPGLEFLHETVAAVFALRFCESQSIGLSVNYNCQRIKVNGLEIAANPTFPFTLVFDGSVDPDNATNKGYNYSNGVGVTIGYLGEFFNCLRVGAAYQPQTHMSKFHKYRGFIADFGKFNNPSRWMLGVSYKVLPCLAVAFDWEHINWREIRMLKNPTFPNLSTDLLGSKDGAGFGWKNQNFYRVGIEWRATSCLDLRLGFRHANTPVRRHYTAVNLLTMDVAENFITTGATYHINCKNELSFFFAYGFRNTVKGKDSIPLILGGGNTDLTEGKTALGFSWGRHF